MKEADPVLFPTTGIGFPLPGVSAGNTPMSGLKIGLAFCISSYFLTGIYVIILTSKQRTIY